MVLDTKKKGDITIIKLEGRIDVHISIEVEDAVFALIEKGEKYLVFDLSKIDYLSSNGLRIFISASRKLKSIGGALKIASAKKNVVEIFEVVDLSHHFDFFKSIDQAIKSFNI